MKSLIDWLITINKINVNHKNIENQLKSGPLKRSVKLTKLDQDCQRIKKGQDTN